MTSRTLQDLENARYQLVLTRRELAQKMSVNTSAATGLKPADFADRFVSAQNAIEALDRAIADERRLLDHETKAIE